MLDLSKLFEPPLLVLVVMVYLVVTGVILYSNRLAGIYKWGFSLTFLPVFLVLMFFNIWIADHLFPHIIEWQKSLPRRQSGAVAFFITTILPITVCWLWYVLFVRLSLPHRKNQKF